MEVSVSLDGNQPGIGVGSALFRTRVSRFVGRYYWVSRDCRFLVKT